MNFVEVCEFAKKKGVQGRIIDPEHLELKMSTLYTDGTPKEITITLALLADENKYEKVTKVEGHNKGYFRVKVLDYTEKDLQDDLNYLKSGLRQGAKKDFKEVERVLYDNRRGYVAFEYNNEWRVCECTSIQNRNGVACFVYNTKEDGKCLIKFKKRVYKDFTPFKTPEGKTAIRFGK